jgi:hypothetical protein
MTVSPWAIATGREEGELLLARAKRPGLEEVLLRLVLEVADEPAERVAVADLLDLYEGCTVV